MNEKVMRVISAPVYFPGSKQPISMTNILDDKSISMNNINNLDEKSIDQYVKAIRAKAIKYEDISPRIRETVRNIVTTT